MSVRKLIAAIHPRAAVAVHDLLAAGVAWWIAKTLRYMLMPDAGGSFDARLEHDHAIVGAESRMELAVPDVERHDARGATLEQAIGEAARRRAQVEAVLAGGVDPERL